MGTGEAAATGVVSPPGLGGTVFVAAGTGVFDEVGTLDVAVRVGASVIVARRVAVFVGVGDLGSTAATMGGAYRTVTTIQPKMQPSAVPAIRASTSCRTIGW